MTAFTEWFCDYCNPAGQRPEVSERGYARELAPNTPLGWWEVPGKGPGDTPGHACPECVIGDDAVRRDIAKRRGDETRRLVGELERPTHDKVIFNSDELTFEGTHHYDERESDDPTPGWPSRTSPFDG